MFRVGSPEKKEGIEKWFRDGSLENKELKTGLRLAALRIEGIEFWYKVTITENRRIK